MEVGTKPRICIFSLNFSGEDSEKSRNNGNENFGGVNLPRQVDLIDHKSIEFKKALVFVIRCSVRRICVDIYFVRNENKLVIFL